MRAVSSDWIIYHNPRCSKSRAALERLREKGIQPRVVEYLSEGISRDELSSLLALLKLRPRDLVRTKEPLLDTLGLDLDDDGKVLGALVQHPTLLERPIVVSGTRAVVARPPEALAALLADEGKPSR